jgi:Domain of unknown function (DUF427)
VVDVLVRRPVQASGPRGEGVTEHRQPASGLFGGGLVLDDIPVFGEHAVFDSYDVCHDPMCGLADIVESAVHAFPHLQTSDTETICPYKGITSQYWSVKVREAVYPDLAWTYDYPLREVAPIAGMIAFYNEKLDIFVDGTLLLRPLTHFA